MPGKRGRPRAVPPLADHSYDHDKQQNVGRKDGWENWNTGQGTHSYDKTRATYYERDYRIDDDQLSSLYYGNDLSKLIVDSAVDESFRRGYELNITNDKDNALRDKLEKWKPAIDTAARDLLRWSRLFGGGAIYLDVEDGLDLVEPLDVTKIKKITSLRVFDRRYVWPLGYDTDPTSPTYWLPEYYGFGGSLAGSQLSPRVHHSRLLRAVGLEADRREAQYLMWWGHSVLQPVYQTLMRFGLSEQAVIIMMQDATQFIFYIQGLIEAIAADDDQAIAKRYQLIDMQRGVGRALLLDAGGKGTDAEKVEKQTTPFTGVSDQLKFFMQRVAAAARMPMSVLFGTGSAAGSIGGSGEGDLRIWHSDVAAYQVREVEPILRRLYALVAAVEGIDADLIKFTWAPLYEPTALEDAQVRNQIATADNIYIQAGVVRPEEVALSRWGSGKFSPEMSAIDLELTRAALIAAPAPEPVQAQGQPPNMPGKPGQAPQPGITSTGPVQPPSGVTTEKGAPVAVAEKPDVNASNEQMISKPAGSDAGLNAHSQGDNAPLAGGEYGGSNSAATEVQISDVTGRGTPMQDRTPNKIPVDVSGGRPDDTPVARQANVQGDPVPTSGDAISEPSPNSDLEKFATSARAVLSIKRAPGQATPVKPTKPVKKNAKKTDANPYHDEHGLFTSGDLSTGAQAIEKIKNSKEAQEHPARAKLAIAKVVAEHNPGPEAEQLKLQAEQEHLAKAAPANDTAKHKELADLHQKADELKNKATGEPRELEPEEKEEAKSVLEHLGGISEELKALIFQHLDIEEEPKGGANEGEEPEPKEEKPKKKITDVHKKAARAHEQAAEAHEKAAKEHEQAADEHAKVAEETKKAAEPAEKPAEKKTDANPYHDEHGLFTSGDLSTGAQAQVRSEADIKPAQAGDFHAAFGRAFANSPFKNHVTHYTLQELNNMKLYMTADHKAGIAVHDHGDGRIEGTALFNQGATKGAGLALLKHAVKEAGVNYLECYGDKLKSLYEKAGFHVTSVSDFNKDYAAKDWDYSRFPAESTKYYTLSNQPEKKSN